MVTSPAATAQTQKGRYQSVRLNPATSMDAPANRRKDRRASQDKRQRYIDATILRGTLGLGVPQPVLHFILAPTEG